MSQIEFSDPAVQLNIDTIQQSGAEQYASWNEKLFAELCDGPVSNFWEHLQEKSDDFTTARRVFDAYLLLMREAVGTELLRSAPRYYQMDFFQHCVFDLLPEQIARFSPSNQVGLLAKLWNLAEGLAREPSWVSYYVTSQLDELTKLSQVEKFLVKVLDPVLAPAPPSNWEGPFQQTILDPRPVDEDFLPGEITLTAPRVMSVKDRHRKRELGVLLQKGGQSTLIGMMADSSHYEEPGLPPAPQWQPDSVQINTHHVELPFLRDRQSYLITRSGFLIATAVDSQRLWIVESA